MLVDDFFKSKNEPRKLNQTSWELFSILMRLYEYNIKPLLL